MDVLSDEDRKLDNSEETDNSDNITGLDFIKNDGKFANFLRDDCIINYRHSAKNGSCKTQILENQTVVAGYRRVNNKYVEEKFEQSNKSNLTLIETESDGAKRRITLEYKSTKSSAYCYTLLEYDKAPEYLRFNEFIRYGYRGHLQTNDCVSSIFWLTNESINIWSHIFGWLLFFGLTLYDLLLLNFHASLADKLIVGGMLLCFQFCMISSALYHTFSCHSHDQYHCFLKYDLIGIVGSMLAIYLSGIYYAFWCHMIWCKFYISLILSIFLIVLIIQMMNCSERFKVISFLLWAVFGFVPTVHWAIMMGGWENPIVEKLLPRVINMYIISGVAFGVYISYIPERFFPGRFDFFGSSHQIWHIFVVLALYYWHNTGISYIEYRMSHGCLMTDCSDFC